MKRFIFIFAMLIAFIHFEASSQFDIAWYKNLPNGITTVNFSHDSKWIMAWLAPNILIFDAATGELVNDKISSTECQYPVFSNDDSHLYGRNGNRISYFNLETGLNESNFDPSEKNLGATDVSKDENYIVSTTEDGFVVWDVVTGKIIKSKLIPKDTTVPPDPYQDRLEKQENLQVNFHCDNSKIYLRTYYEYYHYDNKGNKVYSGHCIERIFDFNTLDSIGIIPYATWTFNFSKDCNLIAFNNSDNDNNIVDIYNTKTWELISKLQFKYPSPLKYEFTSDNKYMVTASSTNANTLILWDVQTGEKLREMGTGSFDALDISNDTKYIAISGSEQIGILEFPKIETIKDDIIDENEILFPNPTTGILTLSVEIPNSSILNINLMDLSGNKISNIYNKFIKEGINNIQIDLSKYSIGTYIFHISALNYEKNFKVIISK